MKTKLQEIIDFEKVDTLLEGFNKTTGFVTAILDLDGNVLSKSGWRQMCTEFHRVHPETAKKCTQSDTELANKMAKGKSFHYYQCLNGLVDVAVPLIINEEHVANLFTGQFFFEEPDKSYFQKQAEKYGFDEKKYLEALDKVPVVSKEKVQVAMDFLLNMTQLISEMTLQKMEQMELNKALKESKEKFKNIFEGNIAPMLLIDADNGNLADVNEAAVDYYGWSRDEMLRMNINQINTLSPEEIKKEMAKARKFKRVYYEFKHRKADSSVRDVEVFASRINIEGKVYLHLIIHDITDRKQAEEKLKSNYGLLRIAGETARFGGWDVDLKTNIATWSDAVADIHEVPHGYAPSVDEGIHFYAPEFREKITQVFTDCAQKGIPYDEEMEIITSKGKHVWVRTTGRAVKDENGKISKVQGSFQDITESKQAEELKRESERKLATLIDNFRGMVYSCLNDQNWTIKFVNQGAYALTGYHPEDLINNRVISYNAMIHPDDRASVWESVRESTQKLTPFEMEYRIITREQMVKWVWERGQGVYSKSGELISLEGFITDITERKQSEVMLKKEKAWSESIVNNAPNIIVGLGEKSIIKVFNHYAEVLTGYKAEEVIGKEWITIFVPNEIQETIYQVWDEVAKNKLTDHHAQNEIIIKSGEKRLIEWSNTILTENEEFRMMLSIGADITERKKTEEALKQSEENLSITLHSIGDGVISTDINGLVANMNSVAEKLCGWKLADALGKPLPEVFKIINAETRQTVADPVARVLEKGEIVGLANHTVLISNDGTEYQIADSAAPIKDKEGIISGVVLVFSDVTEKYAKELALKESEERFKALHNASFGGIIIHDKGIILECNQGLSEITGYSYDELIGMNGLLLIAPETRDLVMNNILAGYEKPYEAIGLRKNGELFPTRVEERNIPYKGKIVRTAEFRDITKQKQADEALRQSEEMMRNSQSVAHIGSYSTNLNATEIDKSAWVCSPELYKIMGIDESYPHTIEGWAGLIHPDFRDDVFAYHESVVKEKKQFNREYKIIRNNDGAERWVQGTGELEFDKEGKPVRMHGAIQDITERKQAEENLKQKQILLRTIVDSIPDAIYVKDTECRKVLANKADCINNGVKKEEDVIGTTDFDLFPAEIAEKFFKDDQEVMKQGASIVDKEEELMQPNGDKKWLLTTKLPLHNVKGEIIGLVGIGHNITERKQSEEALKQSEDRFKKLSSFTFEGIIIHNNAIAIDVNRSTLNLVGYERDEMIGMNLFSLIHPDYHAIAKNNLKEQVVTPYQIIVIRKDGSTFDAEIEARDIVYNDENFRVACIRDITVRKQVEDALQQSEEKFRTYFNESPIGIELYDAEGFQINANKASLSMFGISDINELKVFNLFDGTSLSPENKEILHRAESVSYQSTFDFDQIKELKQYHSSRSGKAYFDYLITPLWNSGSKSLLGYMLQVQDITERKQAEMIKQLQYNIANATVISKSINELFDTVIIELNSIIDAKNLVIALYNEETGMFSANMERDEKDKIPVWPAEKSLTGYAIRQNRSMLLRKNEILRLYKEGIIDLIGTVSEAWLGVPLKVGGKILGAIVVQNFDDPDVYDQTSIEIMELIAYELSVFIDWQLSIEKATKLSRAVEQSSVSVMITNREGFIEYVNPFFTKITGYSFEEAKGKNPNILKSGHQSSTFYKELWDTILSGSDWEGEMLNKKKNGELYWDNIIISPIVNGDGLITNFISIKEDITERKKMVEDLVSAKEKAEESDRLKSAFLANMSHEIRTPMNGILGFSELLKDSQLTGQEQQQYIEVIEKSGKRMLNIINDIIDISKIEAGLMKVDIKETNINEQIEYIYTFFKPEVEAKGMKLSFSTPLPANEATIATDREKVYAILTNLVKNAIKYSNKGTIEIGYVLISSTSTPVSEPVELEFYVKDTGIGIPKERQEAIFERFIQADIADKMARQGAGLGLSITKAYIAMLGGKIWVESEEGRGSTFYFTLPYNAELVKETAFYQTDISDKKENIKKLKILIAEDDEVSKFLLEAQLITVGKEILIAKTGFDAVETCKNNPDMDLVFMDIQMPEMNGYEATRKIREFNKELVIIAQTAYGLSGEREKAMEAGCNDYISKPLKKQELLKLVNKYFGE